MAGRPCDRRGEGRAAGWHRAAAATFGLMLALATLVSVGAMDYETAEPSERGASEGVFTEEQRDAGQEVFAASCAHCHGADLGGGAAPPLDDLSSTWGGSSLGSLFRFVSTNMPMDAPGSLSDDDYAAAIAFVLSENDYPPGDEPLPTDDETLDDIVLDELPLE